MTSEKNQGDVRAAIETVERLASPTAVGADTVARGELFVVPDGLKVLDLKPHLDARLERPVRIAGTARLSTLMSFVEHVKRFADPATAIFAVADPKSPKLIAVFDYHEPRPEREGEGSAITKNRARFGAHRGEYAFPLSAEWQAWAKIDGQELPQAAFASMLEDRIADVVDPASIGEGAKETATVLGISLATASSLLALSRGLSLRVDAKVTQAINLSSGEASIGFEETHAAKDGGPLKVPSGFVIGVPVFRAGTVYSIVARLRYRIANGAVMWRVVLHRPDAVFDHAFAGSCAEAEKDTGTPLFYGTPETV